MTQYRLYKWDYQNNLTFLGEEISDDTMTPGQSYLFVDDDDHEFEWIVSEVHYPNPKTIDKPNGKKYRPDPIVILRPA